MRLLREAMLAVAAGEAPAPTIGIGGGHAVGWHSPVPYLFGGLAAMLGLIAFALLILACSYWKLSAYPEPAQADADADEKAKKAGPHCKEAAWGDNNVLVIMAGHVLPTFLGTPSTTTSRSSSFASNSTGDASTAPSSEQTPEKPALQLPESVPGEDLHQHQPQQHSAGDDAV